MTVKLQVLLFVAYYLPGYRAGGPIRSIANLVRRLGDEIDFKIVTADRDLGNDKPYDGLIADTWLPAGKAQVMYLSPRAQKPDAILRLVRQVEHDILYLNSFFARPFSIVPMLLYNLKLLSTKHVLLAPRGEFAPSALSLKSRRKHRYMRLAFGLRLYRHVTWHASSEFERADILQVLPRPHEREILIAGSVSSNVSLRTSSSPATITPPTAILTAPDLMNPHKELLKVKHLSPKKPGELRLIFIGRIARMKNLVSALDYLTGLKGAITFNIFGPLEDAVYWKECQAMIDQLPANIRVIQHGEVSHDEVYAILAQHDLFILPTLGENFGHAIGEAMATGCPVLISNRTPWRNLEQSHAGFDVPLEQPERFREILQFFVDTDEPTHHLWRMGAQAHVSDSASLSKAVAQNRQMFAQMAALVNKQLDGP